MSVSCFKVKRRKKDEEINKNEDNLNLIEENIFEFIAPIYRFKNKPSLGVTTFSRQMWCEKSLEICLEKNIKITSKAIEEGLKHHEELELEDHDIINVMVENDYEKVGVDILNITNLLNGIIKRGYVRELPIIGFYNGIMIRGIIDSIKFKPKLLCDNNEYDEKYINEFRILITDTKTRRNTTLPSNMQQKTTVLQLGLYKKILKQMIDFGRKWRNSHLDLNTIDSIKKHISYLNINHDLNNCCEGCKFLYDIFKFYDINPFISFKELRETHKNKDENQDHNKDIDENKDDFLEKDKDVDVLIVLQDFENLIQIGFLMLLKLSKLPEIQPEMKVEYDCQGKTFATKWYKSEEEIVNIELEYLLGWWLGYRETESVSISESWKCRYCNVIEYCQVCPLPIEEKEKYILQNRQNELDLLLVKDLEETSCFVEDILNEK